MILSVSRRTDIPNYYSDWFYNRIREGYLYVRNPMNSHQISKINLSPEVVDGIVFWTKNPTNLLPRLDELHEYSYGVHFTITGYGREIEPQIPDKKEKLIQVFQQLSDRIGSENMVWRYDPVLFNHNYSPEYHLKAFEEIAANLSGYTRKVSVNLIDLYQKTKRNTQALNLSSPLQDELSQMIDKMQKIADRQRLELVTCSAQNWLTGAGIKGEGCISQSWMEQVIACNLKAGRDQTQRDGCGCIESIDVGTYHTCLNGCKYCYANDSDKKVKERAKLYDVNSPLLCGKIEDGDKITERKVKSLKEIQLNLFQE